MGVSRSHHYYKKRAKCRADIEEQIKLKELFIKFPFNGYRKHVYELKKESIVSTTKRVRRLMREMDL
ncbi:IS3 family transposase [Marispirochaeta aestuarii]|uniref:IS3 family transposase n=1 Tax=Marispirochaeta aestuarii TaxID=1963862 RepID=UPI0029C6D15C|nr:IS3 family transposase [Marispirochaeta aestuarii]